MLTKTTHVAILVNKNHFTFEDKQKCAVSVVSTHHALHRPIFVDTLDERNLPFPRIHPAVFESLLGQGQSEDYFFDSLKAIFKQDLRIQVLFTF